MHALTSLGYTEPLLRRERLLEAVGIGRGAFDSWQDAGLYAPVISVGRGIARHRPTYTLLDAIRLAVIKIMLLRGENQGFVRSVVAPGAALDEFVLKYFRATDEERDLLAKTVWVTHSERGQGVVNFLEMNQSDLATFGSGEGAYYGLSDIWWLRPAGVIGRLLLVLSFDLQRHFRIPPEL
jgi:hypothetical protein